MNFKRIGLITLIILSTSIAAEEIPFDQFSDKLGDGVLSQGTSVTTEELESDICAFRNIYDEQGRQSIEFDFMGFSKDLPDQFVFPKHQLKTRVQGNTTYYIKNFSAAGLGKFAKYLKRAVCLNKGDVTAFKTELGVDSKTVSIRWVAQCSEEESMQLVEHFRELSCTLNPDLN